MPEAEVQETGLAKTIDEVIERLDAIIERAKTDNSRIGFFAALYRQVTVRVKVGILGGDFEDGPRMERLDVIFANRYLKALQQYQNGQQPTKSWLIAFDTSKRWRPLILQHLLLGINAHINLDLGIAAAQTSPGEEISTLKTDFFRINRILSELLDVVQDKINTLSPGFKWLDKVGGRTDEAIMNFSIQRARDEAWGFAQKLSPLSEAEQAPRIQEKDREIEALAKIVRNPGWLVRIVAFVIRVFETGNVPHVINTLF